jgi:hypothetical protein
MDKRGRLEGVLLDSLRQCVSRQPPQLFVNEIEPLTGATWIAGFDSAEFVILVHKACFNLGLCNDPARTENSDCHFKRAAMPATRSP